MVEIRKHIMVPPHEIMSGDEVKKLLERYRITKKELPKILMSDPVIKEMNAKIGDVLKITRKSAIAGVSYYYRVVVEE
jgi:DNA-directed RNA polymerase, subunit H (EC 2.7.7.6)